jgi:hypothetical protein
MRTRLLLHEGPWKRSEINAVLTVAMADRSERGHQAYTWLKSRCHAAPDKNVIAPN